LEWRKPWVFILLGSSLLRLAQRDGILFPPLLRFAVLAHNGLFEVIKRELRQANSNSKKKAHKS
jgi:hypothetical protein